MTWFRPENLKFPEIWYSFEAKDPDIGNIVKYRVQDIPEDRFKEVEHLMETIFNRDEVSCRAIDAVNNQQFNTIRSSIVKITLSQKISLICFKEGSDEICGINLLEILEKESEEKNFQNPNQVKTDLRKVADFIKRKADPFNKYNVDKYISAVGLIVIPKYRGLNLATEILKARVPLCRGLGIKLTGTVFTGPASQKAAQKAGFVNDYEARYADFEDSEPYVKFPNIACETIKFMTLRIME
ncbi:hypothetical protein DMENIID0001_013990 [Sergentomyia squamirostris]